MSNLKIINKDALLKLLKTISWLDSKRWNVEDNYYLANFFSNNLTKCEKILTHWICYITDRQMPFENVWDKGGYVFSELVYEYSREEKLSPKEILDKHYEEYKDDKKKDKLKHKFKSTDGTEFASRYITDDYQNILQTLEVLACPEYNRNIVVFILKIMQRVQNEEDLLLRVACGLHLLTYKLDGKKANADQVLKILNDDREFDAQLNTFKENSTKGKKRLWCSIRDYKKGPYNKIFTEAINDVAKEDAEELIKTWNRLPLDQIELPGDVWNNSPLFRDNLFANVLDFGGDSKKWGMPKVVREIYNQLKNKNEVKGFYPEQFDITFDFVPRMCNKKLCKVCLFGKNGVDSICIPTEDKYCPVALLSCGYVAKCVGKDCIIKEGISKGICKGGLR